MYERPMEVYADIADKRAARGAKALTLDEMFLLFKQIDAILSEASNQETETDEDIRTLVEHIHHQRKLMTN